MALEWGTDYDIRVNGIAPGPIDDTPGLSKLAPDEIKRKVQESRPLYKLGEKWDIAMAALYLVSDTGELLSSFVLVILAMPPPISICRYYGKNRKEKSTLLT